MVRFYNISVGLIAKALQIMRCICLFKCSLISSHLVGIEYTKSLTFPARFTNGIMALQLNALNYKYIIGAHSMLSIRITSLAFISQIPIVRCETQTMIAYFSQASVNVNASRFGIALMSGYKLFFLISGFTFAWNSCAVFISGSVRIIGAILAIEWDILNHYLVVISDGLTYNGLTFPWTIWDGFRYLWTFWHIQFISSCWISFFWSVILGPFWIINF